MGMNDVDPVTKRNTDGAARSMRSAGMSAEATGWGGNTYGVDAHLDTGHRVSVGMSDEPPGQWRASLHHGDEGEHIPGTETTFTAHPRDVGARVAAHMREPGVRAALRKDMAQRRAAGNPPMGPQF